jgi:hypothetical protein
MEHDIVDVLQAVPKTDFDHQVETGIFQNAA